MIPQSVVDGITAEVPQSAVNNQAVRRMRNILSVLLGIPYLAFIGWCIFLITFFPHQGGDYSLILRFGVMSCLLALGVFFLVAVVLFLRIIQAKGIIEKFRRRLLLKLIVLLLPGIGLAAGTPFLIQREPGLSIEILEPTNSADLVAPLSVKFGLEQAMNVLAKKNLSGVSYTWDFEGDGTVNKETVLPEVTAYYQRPGLYRVVVRIMLNDGSVRRVVRPFKITDAVFAAFGSTSPDRLVVDEPVRFSVQHLQTKENAIAKVEWDFDADGTFDVSTAEVEAVHTFFTTGQKPVRAVVTFAGQNQEELLRTIVVQDPPPLPFPIEIVTDPELLISPVPFGTVFSVQSEEPLKEVRWDFDDGAEMIGESVGHTFDRKGNFAVSVQARSVSGEIARLTKMVQVVETLKLGDLVFNGSPEVKNNKIEGVVPLTVDLTPATSIPLVQFYWEAPGATVVGSTRTRLQAIYRREGVYSITLLGHNPDGRAVRIPMTVKVLPAASQVSIYMDKEGGTAPLDVHFDGSESRIPEETISGFEWFVGTLEDFERQRIINVQQRGGNFAYQFQKPGTYKVLLKVRTVQGNVYEGFKTIVVRAPVLEACITATRTVAPVNGGIQFFSSECSAGVITKWRWKFGEEAESDEADPIHYFGKPGEYTVELRLEDGGGSISTDTLSVIINP